jgi:hypothetical protein
MSGARPGNLQCMLRVMTVVEFDGRSPGLHAHPSPQAVPSLVELDLGHNRLEDVGVIQVSTRCNVAVHEHNV